MLFGVEVGMHCCKSCKDAIARSCLRWRQCLRFEEELN